MRRVSAVAACLLFAIASPAQAEDFASSEFGFSITFPVGSQHPPQERLTNSAGALEATVDMFQSTNQRTMCAVGIQKYAVPATAAVADELALNRDNFLKPLGASQSSTERRFQGHPALEFTWRRPDGQAEGRGLVVVVPETLRRVYVVASMTIQGAPEQASASAESCYRSFRIQ